MQRGLWGTITGAVAGAAGAVTSGLRDRVLGTIGTWARRIPGYGVLCVALGRDVITQQPVARDASSIIGALVGLVPGGAAIWENLQQSGAVARAGEWVSGELQRLNLTWEAIRGLFSRAWDALSATDLLNPGAAWQRLSGIFSGPISRLREFASAAGRKLMEFVFEGVLTTAGGAGGQVMAIVRQAGDVLGTIVRNPIGFAGNLVSAVRGGIGQFASRIFDHLRTGLIGWLTGALRGAIQLPTRFDLAGIFSMVTSMLGLGWQWLRGRIVAAVGEPLVRRVETAVDWIRTLVTDGIGGIVGRLGDMVSGLLDTVIGGIRDWVANSVVGAAVTRLISMFNPAGAVIQAILAVYNTIKFFIERAQQLGALAQSVFGSIAAIASGNIGNAVNAVEQALGRAVPVVLGFLSRLIGLGDVAAPVRNVIERIRGVIDRAMDRVIGWVVTAARRLSRAVRGGRAAAGAGSAAGAVPPLTRAVQEATGLLHARGATPVSVRAALGGLRQRHQLTAAELLPGTAPSTYHVHVQRADTPDAVLKDPETPEESAPGIGTILPYGGQVSSMQQSGRPKVWHMIAEHVIPHSYLNSLFGASMLGSVADQYEHMKTIMIYKGAAGLKNRGPSGDFSLIPRFRRITSGDSRRRNRRRRGGPDLAPSRIMQSPENLLKAFRLLARGAVERTVRAVQAEGSLRIVPGGPTNAQRRGKPGSPEPTTPEETQVRRAADEQLEQIVQLWQQRQTAWAARQEAQDGAPE